MSPRPNIVLVMCDDLGWGDVGWNGNRIIRTPHLDRLAADSLRCPRFYAGGPVCSPTRGTCLTGRHYIRYGITHANRGRLPTAERTLAGLCREAGYGTGFFGKWHLGTLTNETSDGNRGGCDPRLYSPPWLHGFQRCFATESKVPTWDPLHVPAERCADGSWAWGEPGTAFGTAYWNEDARPETENLQGCDSRIIVDRAEQFIRREVAAKRAFLAVVWFHAPHTPVVAGPEWQALYPEATASQQHYFGCISAMDAQVGRLQRLLCELNVDADTLLWFCSDNGPEGPELPPPTSRCHGSTGGLRGRKRSLYEGGVGVPGLIRWPRHIPAGDCQVPLSTLDILPTCAAAMGRSLPDDRPLDGIDLLPILRGETQRRSRPIPYRFLSRRRAMAGSPTIAVIDDDWKFLSNLDPAGQHDQLYQLANDRREEHNLAASEPQRCAVYTSFLHDFLTSCRASHAGKDYGGEAVDMITEFQEPGGWSDE